MSPGVMAAIGGAAVVLVGGVLYLALHNDKKMQPLPPPVPTVQEVPPPLQMPAAVEIDENGVPILEAQAGDLPPEIDDLLDAGAGAAGAEPVKPTAPVTSKPAAKGLLDVNCVPWCRIFIDGKDTTRVSPAIGISVAAGKHTLRVVNTPTGIEQEKEIVIRAGATTREVVKF